MRCSWPSLRQLTLLQPCHQPQNIVHLCQHCVSSETEKTITDSSHYSWPAFGFMRIFPSPIRARAKWLAILALLSDGSRRKRCLTEAGVAGQMFHGNYSSCSHAGNDKYEQDPLLRSPSSLHHTATVDSPFKPCYQSLRSIATNRSQGMSFTILVAILSCIWALCLAAPPPQRWDDCGCSCMNGEDARQVALNFQTLITNYTDELADMSLTKDFVDYSDSVSELINNGCSGPQAVSSLPWSEDFLLIEMYSWDLRPSTPEHPLSRVKEVSHVSYALLAL